MSALDAGAVVDESAAGESHPSLTSQQCQELFAALLTVKHEVPESLPDVWQSVPSPPDYKPISKGGFDQAATIHDVHAARVLAAVAVDDHPDNTTFRKPELPEHVRQVAEHSQQSEIGQSQSSLRASQESVLGAGNDRSSNTNGNTNVVVATHAASRKRKLGRDSHGNLRFFSVDEQAQENQRLLTMEEVQLSLYSSDASNLSKTQENDPAVYEKLFAGETENESFISVASFNARGSEADRSYAADETGHLTLHFPPEAHTVPHDNYDEDGTDHGLPRSSISADVSSPAGQPQTPLQQKLNLGRPGTIMRLSQVFAETQATPGSGSGLPLLPSSLRPSPDLFGTRTTPKETTSSPLLPRSKKAQALQAGVDLISSPLKVVQSASSAKSPDAIGVMAATSQTIAIMQTMELEGDIPSISHLPEPCDAYVSRRESQERRMRSVVPVDDGTESSDDGFSDDEIQIRLRARRRKEEAARKLSTIGISRTINSGRIAVEVPSTRSRKSSADNGLVKSSAPARRASPDEETILDSQTAVVNETHPVTQVSSIAATPKAAGNGTSISTRPLTSSMPLSATTVGEEHSQAQHTEVVQSVETEPTASGEETSPLPTQQPGSAPLSEVSNNIGELRTPASARRKATSQGLAVVPETSPAVPHVLKYGEIVSQTPPVPSAEDFDEDYIVLTQDTEFNQLASPSRKAILSPRPRRTVKDIKKFTPATHSTTSEPPARSQPPVSSTTATETVERPSEETGTANGPSLAQTETSVYATALADVQVEVSFGVNPTLSPNRTQGASNTQKEVPRPSWSPLTSPLSSVPHGSMLNSPSDTVKANVVTSSAVTTPFVARSSATPATETTAVVRGLRSSEQLRGSSRILRRIGARTNEQVCRTISEESSPTSSRRKKVRTSGRVTSNAINYEEPTTPTSSAPRRSSVHSPAKTGLFKNMVFTVSYVKDNDAKKGVIRLITQNGGLVLDEGFDSLFTLHPDTHTAHTEPGPDNLTLTPSAHHTTFAALIADHHSRRAKFMQALALGLPCISGRWIEHCIQKSTLLDWEHYLLPAGESSFLGGAVRNRNLQPYPAATARLEDDVARRKKLLEGKSILIVTGKGKAGELKKAYLFLTHALGVRCVTRVQSNQEARKVLHEAERKGDEFDLVYVDDDERDAEKVIFGATSAAAPTSTRKRKRGAAVPAEENVDEGRNQPPPKKVKVINNEFVVQSLILGKLLEDD